MNRHIQHTSEDKLTFCEQLGEDLGAELCAEVEAHLSGCPDCRAHYNSVEQTVELYRKSCSGDDVLPQGVEERLLKVLHIHPEAN